MGFEFENEAVQDGVGLEFYFLTDGQGVVRGGAGLGVGDGFGAAMLGGGQKVFHGLGEGLFRVVGFSQGAGMGELGDGVLAEDYVPAVFFDDINGERAVLGDAESGGFGWQPVIEFTLVVGGGGRPGKEAGDDFLAGETFKVGEFVVEGLGAGPVGGQYFIGIVEGGVGAGFARAMIAVGVGAGEQGGEAGVVGSEGLGGSAEPENFDVHGVALLNLGQDIEAAHDVAENGVQII